MENIFLFYIIAIFLNLISTVFNIQSSYHLNPLLLHFYSAKDVIFLTMSLFSIGAISRIIIFKENIVAKDLEKIILLSFLGSFFGSILLNFIPDKIIVLIFIFSTIFFIFKYLIKKNRKLDEVIIESSTKKTDLFISGFIASFIQSFGISGGPLRQAFYYTKGYSVQAVHGTVAIIFLVHSFTFLASRIIVDNSNLKLLLIILPITPFIFFTTYYSKRILYKIPDLWKDRIMIYSLIIALISILPILIRS